MNLSGTISRLANATVTVTRPGATTYDDRGRASVGAGESFTARVSVQPVTRDGDLLLLPEGSRVSEARIVIAPVELLEGDVVEVPGKGTFKVLSASDWSTAGFSRAFCLKEST